MSGLVWSVPAEGGYLYADELSDRLRMAVQPLTKFRQLCDAEDGSQKGLGRGQLFTWDVITDVARQGWQLDETVPMPETNFTVRQSSLTVQEWGNSVPYSGLLENLAKHKVVNLIDKALKNDCRKAFDKAVFLQFKATTNRYAPTSGTSTTAITVTTNSATSVTNNVAMGTGHVKAISDYMKEANVPPYEGDSYMTIGHPSTFRNFKNQLESIHQYTSSGLENIRYGEIGRYEDTRFIEQTCIPKGGANDSTTFDAINGVADAWNNAASSWAFTIGADTCMEAICIPEEIRAKLPGDFGRSRGIAWYALLNFALVHPTNVDTRVYMWDSAA